MRCGIIPRKRAGEISDSAQKSDSSFLVVGVKVILTVNRYDGGFGSHPNTY